VASDCCVPFPAVPVAAVPLLLFLLCLLLLFLLLRFLLLLHTGPPLAAFVPASTSARSPALLPVASCLLVLSVLYIGGLSSTPSLLPRYDEATTELPSTTNPLLSGVPPSLNANTTRCLHICTPYEVQH
jgi:hypothetical protein